MLAKATFNFRLGIKAKFKSTVFLLLAILVGVISVFVFLKTRAVNFDLFAEMPRNTDFTWRDQSFFAVNAAQNMTASQSLFSWSQINLSPLDSYAKSGLYYSYPQGYLFPHWLLAKFTGATPVFRWMWNASVFNMVFLGAVFGALATILVGANLWALILVGGISTIYFISEAGVHFYPGIWWPDIAGITMVSLLVFWISARQYISSGRGRVFFDCALIFYAAWSDWFAFLAATMFVVLVWPENRRQCKLLFASWLAAVFIYLAPIAINQAWTDWLGKVSERTSTPLGLTGQGVDVLIQVVTRGGNLLTVSIWIIAVLLTIISLRSLWGWFMESRVPKPWVFGWWVLVPAVLLHTAILWEHYRQHPYEYLKWTLFLGVTPIFAISFLRTLPLGKWGKMALNLGLILVVVWTAGQEIERYEGYKQRHLSYVKNYGSEFYELCKEVIAAADRTGSIGVYLAQDLEDLKLMLDANQKLCRNASRAATKEQWDKLVKGGAKFLVVRREAVASARRFPGFRESRSVRDWLIFEL